ncbi:hypothetical protein CALCODRAFT_489635 [Calocera cornea HHB12733]|uniref:Uncharacterized protein n=1 Tax=Calocera cornea HHB12733 TaxID=1353952 RepID=A0A165K3M6_9BASI|nr:hypothetical protein CALCODRAFT_489635 [Calocera cornea HHB12733]
MLVEESTSVTIQTRDSPVPAEPELSPADKSQSSGPEPNELCPTPIETGFADSEVLDFEGKRPPPLRLRNLLDARRSRMARRHSICVASPVSPLDEEVSVPSRKNPLSFGHIRRRSSIGSSTSRGVTSTSSYRPTWGTPSVAFDPPAPPSMTYSDSSPDSGVDVDSPASRPSTSASSYYAPTRTPSVTSFQIMDSVRQSFQQAKFDPEMAETLFQGTTAQNFLRIFRPE